MKRFLPHFALLAALLVTASCSDNGTEPAPTTGTLIAEVHADGVPVPSAQVRLSETEIGTTGADGQVRFENVEPGTITITLIKLPPEFTQADEEVAKTVSVQAGQDVHATWEVGTAHPAAVVQTDFVTFVPATVTIQAGESVRFEYVAGSPHTVTPEDPAGYWIDRPLAEEADNFTVTFNSPGTYRYLCKPHAEGFEPGQGMNGVIIVE